MVDLSRKLNQTATYWVLTGRDLYGKGAFSAPVQLPCRWEDSGELFINKMGQEVVSRAKVFFGSDISLEGYLFLGISAATDPLVVGGAFEIMQKKVTPNLRALQNLYVAFL